MGDPVYANGMEIASKASDCKVVAAFPDVCLSPPSPPAGPVPIPYPISSFASDTDNGSKTVQIGGEEVMLKDQSYYKQCTGDEAATKSLGMGVTTGCITGKVYFTMWSPDVKFEGANVDRHIDTTNGNGQSAANQMTPWPNLGQMTTKAGGNCEQILREANLTPHRYGDAKCPEGYQSDHILQNACFQNKRGKDSISSAKDYAMNDAPCVCLEDGTDVTTEHGRKTLAQNQWTTAQRQKPTDPTYAQVHEANMNAMKEARPDLKENKEAMECLELVVKDYFQKEPPDGLGIKDGDTIRTPREGKYPRPPQSTVSDG